MLQRQGVVLPACVCTDLCLLYSDAYLLMEMCERAQVCAANLYMYGLLSAVNWNCGKMHSLHMNGHVSVCVHYLHRQGPGGQHSIVCHAPKGAVGLEAGHHLHGLAEVLPI